MGSFLKEVNLYIQDKGYRVEHAYLRAAVPEGRCLKHRWKTEGVYKAKAYCIYPGNWSTGDPWPKKLE